MNQEYVVPTLDKEEFTCPHCHTLSLMKFGRHSFGEDNHVVFHLMLMIKELQPCLCAF